MALHCEIVASSYECQPSHSYADFMFCLHSDLTPATVVAGVHTQSGGKYPTEEIPYLVATQFSYIMYWYSICLVSTMCCDTTIAQHKWNYINAVLELAMFYFN